MLLVVGASGGVGASSLLAAVAVRLAHEGRSVIGVDAQPGGSGLDVVLGIEHVPGLRWPDLADARGVDGEAVSAALPRRAGLAVLSHDRTDRPPPRWELVVETVAALRMVADVVLLDLPRSLVGAIEELEADMAVVVAEAAVLGLAALCATAPVVARQVAEVFVVLRSEAAQRAPVGEVRTALDLPVLTVLETDAGVRRELQRGRPPGLRDGPLREAASLVVDILGGAAVGPGPASVGRAS